MARGARQGDTLVFLSGATGWAVEEVAAASPAPRCSSSITWATAPGWPTCSRAWRPRFRSVCLTVDVQVYGRRERDIVARFSPREAMLKAPNPRPPDPDYPARLTWADVAWLRKTTELPIGLKGS